MDVTFLVVADTHFGTHTVLPGSTALNPRPEPQRTTLAVVNQGFIAQMNLVAGRPYPAAIGGHVQAPRGVLVAGDLTEDGKPQEWDEFVAHYGHSGKDAQLAMPVFAVQGNHDKNRGDGVARALTKRHGGLYYGWRWDDLHLLALGEGPDRWVLEWLATQLESIGTEAPVVLWMHYPLLGPYSRGNWFGKSSYAERLHDTIEGHRIIAIFHGHFHGSGHYRWRGYDVYNVGSPKHRMRSFAVVRVTDDWLTVSSWNVEAERFWWWHRKPTTPDGPDRQEPVDIDVGADGRFRPAIPYPIGL
ncbi:MAG: hypothetical protein JRI23_01835 [Deltaproteobacteria bacterium]|jgi:3',5'-cyclic AMP phosphodiesterase CpdA|nr:hypothetical protein [Deltaproteobacteria bacterium]MBW2530215.1 hypothetical protein [Deltaproteobacteria bacterium]